MYTPFAVQQASCFCLTSEHLGHRHANCGRYVFTHVKYLCECLLNCVSLNSLLLLPLPKDVISSLILHVMTAVLAFRQSVIMIKCLQLKFNFGLLKLVLTYFSQKKGIGG